MKRLLLALLLALASAVPAASQPTAVSNLVSCNKTFQVNQGAVALTKIISGIANQNISICGFMLSGGAAASTFSASYGTGTNCGTGTTTVIPLINIAINGWNVDHVQSANIGIPSINASGVAIDFCIVTTGTGPLSILIYYEQL
jgi:hypothetical protein